MSCSRLFSCHSWFVDSPNTSKSLLSTPERIGSPLSGRKFQESRQMTPLLHVACERRCAVCAIVCMCVCVCVCVCILLRGGHRTGPFSSQWLQMGGCSCLLSRPVGNLVLRVNAPKLETAATCAESYVVDREFGIRISYAIALEWRRKKCLQAETVPERKKKDRT